MEEQYSALEFQLIEAVYNSLNYHMYGNASFLAERLLAEHDCEETRTILAECYLRENKSYKLLTILKNCSSERNKYLLSLACLKQNKLKDAEQSLLIRNMSSSEATHVPCEGAGCFLMARVLEKSQRTNEALEYYLRALQMDPTIWVAYEKICRIFYGKEDNFCSLLKLFDEENMKKIHNDSNIFEKIIQRKKNVSLSNMHQNITSTPNLSAIKKDLSAKSASNKKILNTPIHNNQASSPGMSLNLSNMSLHYDEQKLHSNNSYVIKNMLNTSPSPAQQGYFIRKNNIDSTPVPHFLHQDFLGGFKFTTLSEMLSKFGEAYYKMCNYKSTESIDLFLKLPQNHVKTGWIAFNIGKCFIDMSKFSEAEKFFLEGHHLEPYRLEGLEYFSSCLWSLKKPIDSTLLARTALEQSLYAPETWVAVGNCYSLQKEHDTALKYFNRAIQLDPQFAYAHTLCGHEYMYIEDYTKAKKSYENGINFDAKNFNAWWGIGNILLKQEKFDKAVENFKKALEINERCPVLYTYLGIAYSSKNQFKEALKNFTHSEKLDPKNMVNPYQKAKMLSNMNRNEEALKVLEEMMAKVPKESPIPWQIGHIYKKLGDLKKANYYYTIASDLDKDTQKAKGCFDALFTNGEYNDYEY